MKSKETGYPDDINPNAGIYDLLNRPSLVSKKPKESQETILESLEESADVGKLTVQTVMFACELLERTRLTVPPHELIDKMLRGKQSPQHFIEAIVRTVQNTNSQENFAEALEEAYQRFPHLRPQA
jgi:hypothetical protein